MEQLSRQVERRLHRRVAELMIMQSMKLSRGERRKLATLYGNEAYRMTNSLAPYKMKSHGPTLMYICESVKQLMEENG